MVSRRTTKCSQSSLRFSVILRWFWIQPDKEALFQLFCIDLHLNGSMQIAALSDEEVLMRDIWLTVSATCWTISLSSLPLTKGFKHHFTTMTVLSLRWPLFKYCTRHSLVKHMCGFWRKHHVFNTWHLLCPPGNELSSQQLHWLPWKSQVVELRGGQSICFENHRLWLGQLPIIMRKWRVTRTLRK